MGSGWAEPAAVLYWPVCRAKPPLAHQSNTHRHPSTRPLNQNPHHATPRTGPPTHGASPVVRNRAQLPRTGCPTTPRHTRCARCAPSHLSSYKSKESKEPEDSMRQNCLKLSPPRTLLDTPLLWLDPSLRRDASCSACRTALSTCGGRGPSSAAHG